MKALGIITPDPVGELLGTGYKRFTRSDGTNGLFRASGNHLDILAVSVEFEGRGYFRRFMDDCMAECDSIAVIAILNPRMEDILKRWSFKPFEDVESINGETEFISGMKWNKPL